MKQLFDGITVLDFGCGMASSVATMVMSDFGAEVIKVEPPEGDPYRSVPPSLLWNRGKKSVVLDLSTDEGREHAKALAASADVVVESFVPGESERFGLDYESLRSLNPGLVYTSVTGFGPRGPYARYRPYEQLVSAKSGRYMTFAGQNGREGPNYGAVQVASHCAAMAAVRGTVAALMIRDRTGRGQRVETSLLRAITYYDTAQWILWQLMIKFPEDFQHDPAVFASRPAPLHYMSVRTKDGRWMQLANLMQRLFIANVHAIGLGYLLEDPRYAAAPDLFDEPREEMREFILEKMQERTLDEWMDLFVNDEGDVAAEPFMTSSQALDHSQLIHNGFVERVEDPTVGTMRQLGALCRMDGAPPAVQGPAPLLGQHTMEVIEGLDGHGPKPTAATADEFPTYPLEDVTVLDLSTVIAGPLTGSLLSELGARVIRIETVDGDWMRQTTKKGFFVERTMAGTQGLSINLKTTEGQDILDKLLPKVDVVLHNMRPGAPERVGIGLERVRKAKPDAIYVYLGGYGSTGPHSHRPVMHPIGGAVGGGVLAQVGGPDTLPPPDAEISMDELRVHARRLWRANEVNPDPNTAMVTATAITMALYARQRLGTPQYVETTMIGANAYVNADDFFDYDGRPPRPVQDKDGYGLDACQRLYQASDGWVFLMCPFEDEWQRLCQALERADLLEDARFATSVSRRTNDDALASELAAVFIKHRALEWEEMLTPADVGCVQVEDRGMYHFFSEDPHAEQNALTVQVEHPRFGKFWRYGPVLEFSKTSCTVGPGILKGQHTMQILNELGYTADQIHQMKTAGVIDWEDP